MNCRRQEHTGDTVDGGYAEVAYARASGLVCIPGLLGTLEAAPLLCAGLTMFTAVQEIQAQPGALIGVQGIGGLGHLALQYARRLGYRVAAIARGTEKQQLACRLGADYYVNSAEENPAAALQDLGGAAAILATAASGPSMGPLVSGLAPRGQLVVIGTGLDTLEAETIPLISGTRMIRGHLTGTPIENEDNLAFSLANGIHPLIETFPLSGAAEAYEHMPAGHARFRAVLKIAGQGTPAS